MKYVASADSLKEGGNSDCDILELELKSQLFWTLERPQFAVFDDIIPDFSAVFEIFLAVWICKDGN